MDGPMFKRFTFAIVTLFALAGSSLAAGLYPLSNYQQFDSNGKLLIGAKLYFYNGGTTTPRVGYKDSSLTTVHPNPVLTDSNGRIPLIYLADGFYRQRLTTNSGALILDQDGIPVLSSTASGSGTSVDPTSTYKTRDIKVRFDDQPLSGYVRLNGRTIGSASSGATERANADTQPLYEELWTFANISVSAGKGATAAADFAANKTLTLPDASGRGLFGMDDLGAGARSVLTSTTCTGPTLPGAVCGAQTVTLSQAQLPAFTLTGGSGTVSTFGTTGIESANHIHSGSGTTGAMSANATHTHGATQISSATTLYAGGGANGYAAGASAFQSVTAGFSINSANTDHTHSFSYSTGIQNANHTHDVSATGTASSISISSGGSGTAVNKLSPAILLMIYIRL